MSPGTQAQVLELRSNAEGPAHNHGAGITADLEGIEVVAQSGPMATPTAQCLARRDPAKSCTVTASEGGVDGAGRPKPLGWVLGYVAGHLGGAD